MTQVEFFAGIASRYSYLASTQIAKLEADTGCSVNWRPLYSGDLMTLRGPSPFAGTPSSGQYEWEFRRRDAEAWAEYYGVPYVESVEALKFDRELLRTIARACTAAVRLGLGAAYSACAMAAVFSGREGHDFTQAFLCSLANEVGGDGVELGRVMAEAETAAQLTATTREAFDRGAFGVPTFFVGDTMFWGNDRLVLLRHHLLAQK